MKSLFKRMVVIGAVVSICSVFSAAFGADVKFVTIGTAAPGGTFYVLGVGMADVINKNVKGFKATAITTGGAMENLRLLGDGKINVGLSNIRSHSQAYLGLKPFTKAYEEIRKGFFIGTYVYHIATTPKTGIKTVYDLKGKTVSLGTSGSIAYAVGSYVLKVHGIDISDVKVKYIGPSEAVDALRDGIIDAFTQYSALPSPAVNALAARGDVVLVVADRKKLDEAQAKERYLSFTVPARTYKGQDQDVAALAVVGTADFNVKDDEDFVYQVTKAIVENTAALKQVHPAGGNIRLLTKEEADISPLVFHPGVLKYSKEAGIKY